MSPAACFFEKVVSFHQGHSEIMSDKRTDEVKGRIKVAAGELTGDNKLKAEGQVDKASAKVKDAVDKTKDALKGKK